MYLVDYNPYIIYLISTYKDYFVTTSWFLSLIIIIIIIIIIISIIIKIILILILIIKVTLISNHLYIIIKSIIFSM